MFTVKFYSNKSKSLLPICSFLSLSFSTALNHSTPYYSVRLLIILPLLIYDRFFFLLFRLQCFYIIFFTSSLFIFCLVSSHQFWWLLLSFSFICLHYLDSSFFLISFYLFLLSFFHLFIIFFYINDYFSSPPASSFFISFMSSSLILHPLLLAQYLSFSSSYSFLFSSLILCILCSSIFLFSLTKCWGYSNMFGSRTAIL